MALKLFVWTDYARDYSAGLAVVLAEDSDQARDMIEEKAGYRAESLAERPDVYEIDVPIAVCVAGGG